MKITRKTLKRITIISAVAGLAIFFVAFPFYWTSADLDYILVIAFTTAVLPPGIASIIHNRWQNKIEKATPEFLRDIATSFRTGMPLYTALEHAAKRDYGPLTTELKLLVSQMSWGLNFNKALTAFSKRIDLPLMNKATTLILEAGRHGGDLSNIFDSTAKRDYGPLTTELKLLVSQMSWGLNFNKALNAFSKRIDLPLMNKATTLILEAGRHGGDLSNIFDSTAKYVDNVNAWTNKRRTQTLPYVAIFYFSVVIFLFIIILISNMIFVPMSELSVGGSGLINPILTPETARRVFLHTALLEAFFGGILAGRIHENSFFGGLKHAAVLAIVSGLAFFIFFQ